MFSIIYRNIEFVNSKSKLNLQKTIYKMNVVYYNVNLIDKVK